LKVTMEAPSPLSRSSWSLEPQRNHLILGSCITIATLLWLAMYVQEYWVFQAFLVSDVLVFAGVPHSVFLSSGGYGAGFLGAIPPAFLIDKMNLPRGLIIAVVAAVLLAMLVVAIIPRLSPPIKIVTVFFLTLVLINVAYEMLHPEQPSPLQIDWLTSGIVIIPLIALVFNVTIFPIPGSLSTKLAGLLGCLLFSVGWSIVRFSLASASLFYLGTFSFMFLEYLPGAFVDFTYVLLFYSLVMYRLATWRKSG